MRSDAPNPTEPDFRVISEGIPQDFFVSNYLLNCVVLFVTLLILRRCSSTRLCWMNSIKPPPLGFNSIWDLIQWYYFFGLGLIPAQGRRPDFSLVDFRFGRAFLPKPKSAQKRIRVFSEAAAARQVRHFACIPATEYYFVRFDGGSQPSDHIRHVAPPLLLAKFLQSPNPDVILKG